MEKGDIYYIESRNDTVGSEQQAGRPAVIVSNNKNNENSTTIEVVYLTTQPKHDLPTHVTVHGTGRQSTAICEQISTVSTERCQTYAGKCTVQELAAIDIAMSISLGIDLSAPPAEKKEKQNPVQSPAKQEPSASSVERDIYKKLYEQLLEKVMVSAR